jgi:preprotein translocase subunit SecG
MKDHTVANQAPQKSPDGANPPAINSFMQDQDFLTVETKKKTVRKSTYCLVALFVVGLLCLLFMIKKTSPQQAKAAAVDSPEAKIEAAISQLTGIGTDPCGGVNGIVHKFDLLTNFQQVKLNELQKNPFEKDVFIGNIDLDKQKNNDDAALFRQRQLAKQAKNVKLLSIISSGAKRCCMINNKILYEGDSVKDFKITQIGSDFVKIESEQPDANNVPIMLKLSE